MQIFIAVNKNGKVSLHAIEPTRNNNSGTWISNRPYVNYYVQENIDEMIRHSTMSWNMDPEVIEIDIAMINEQL